ncbi:MAG: hypothetical protein JJ837_07590 [Prochlorococcus marinus XMU1428]|nr:hypothetical protein [Prochlorococcus marinus XMU1428]
MKPAISRKMDMVKDVFLNNKRIEESIAFAEFIENHDAIYDDDYTYPQLLIEGNSRKKVSTKKNKISNKKICRIKNNKGDFVDIKKIKQDKKDDSHVLELPSPDGEENLISIGNQMTIPESLRLLEKVKRGKKKFKDFISQKPTFIRRKTEEILY